ncbi:PucR family transcriptional regulator, partial [Streptococcus agalactiae]|nr:PucR family transcriptional regulator [Streptococcus agalactiae]
MKLRKQLAQQIVTSIKDVCQQDINFINTKGIIFASTNPKRVGEFHEIGLKVAQTGQMIEVTDQESYFGTQAGINIPFYYN